LHRVEFRNRLTTTILSSFLIDPWTYNYYHSKWTNDYTNKISSYDGIHTTNITQDKALAMIDDAAAIGEQFFMMVAPGEARMHDNGFHAA
jgi:hypothetical protein